MGVSKITFYQAENTLLYMPLKLASEQGIFESMFKKYDKTSSAPEIKIKSLSGDMEAVQSLLLETGQEGEIIIAIADPMAIFKSEQPRADELRIIGQFITKFPFWIISKGSKTKDLYCPGNKYVTAHACSTYFNAVDKDIEELQRVTDFEVVSEVKKNGGWGLSGEIDKIFDDDIHIEQHLARDLRRMRDDFSPLVSVLITKKSVCENYNRDVLPRVLESIMNAIFILYSSQEMAETTIKSIAGHLPEKTVTNIASIIRSDQFYPHTLDINESDWIDTYEFYYERKTLFYSEKRFPDLNEASSEKSKRQDVLSKYFKIFYNGVSARIVERRLIEEFGVTCSTFDTGIDKYIKDRKRDRHRMWMSTYGPFLLALSLIMLGIGTEFLALYNILVKDDNTIIPWVVSAITMVLTLLSFYYGPAKNAILNRVKNGKSNSIVVKRKK